METFEIVPGFCSDCGAILPLLRRTGNVNCYTCSRIFDEKGMSKDKLYVLNFKQFYFYRKTFSLRSNGGKIYNSL